MQRRKLGTSDLELTTIGLGTWAMGGGNWKFGWGHQDPAEGVAAIHAALDAGINWIDTAPVYGGGRAEQLVGDALAALPSAKRPYVATKCGRILESPDNVFGRLKRSSVREECEASLRRLRVDTIDLYQIHWPDPEADIEEAWDEMIRLRGEGKIRHLGVSNHHVAHMERLRRRHAIASLQPPYSLIARDIEREILPYCREHRMGVIAYSPMGKGLLTGAFNAQRLSQLDADDHRRRDPRFLPPQLDINLAFVDGIAAIAHQHGRTTSQLAIAWVLSQAGVTAAIVGARRPAQIQETAPAGDWTLDAATLSAIESLCRTRDAALNALAGSA